MARRSAAALRVVKEERERPPSAAPQRDGYADTGEVEAFAAELPEKFLHCREMNHNWRPTVGGTRYEYPEGYQAKELGRIVGEGRGVLRLESIKRITKGS